MRLLLLRHGQTGSNVSGALDTAAPGARLTPLGHAQATAAAQALAEREIEAVGVSTLTRTHETAAPLTEALGLTVIEHDGFREVAAGAFEMAADEDSVRGYLETIGAWLKGDLDHAHAGGETGHAFLERYDAAVAAVTGSVADCALVVSHGAAIRTWVTHRAVGTHVDPHIPLHNTGCITLTGSPETGWTVEDWHTEPVGGDFLDDPTAPDPTAHD